MTVELSEALKLIKDPNSEALLRQGKATPRLHQALILVEQSGQSLADEAHDANRLAFARLSYVQCLKLNSWWTGTNIILDFDANRVGKTAACVFNALLWMFPNDQLHTIFKPYQDEFQRPIHLLPRPPLRNIRLIRHLLQDDIRPKNIPRPSPLLPFCDIANTPAFNYLQSHPLRPLQPAFPFPPVYPQSAYEPATYSLWVGVPMDDFYEDTIHPEWIKWLPASSILRDVVYQMQLDIEVHTPLRTIKWRILGKSYEAKKEKWAGKAVTAIILTEGVPQDKLNEVKQRFTEHCFGSWDYTPYEDKQIRSSSAIAYKFFKGEDHLPGQSITFTGFGIHKTPTFILPKAKREEMIQAWEGKPEGEARIHGNFYSATLLVLTHLDPALHCLPWTTKELFERYPNHLLFRSIDPGRNHPTACTWALLTPSNEWFIYRAYCKSGTTISERCEDIIRLSGNERIEKNSADLPHDERPANREKVFAESQISERYTLTWMDYHAFITDEETGRPYILKYINEGIIPTKSITLGPEDRAGDVNDILKPRIHHPHPLTNLPPGSGVYFLINETGVSQLYQSLENLHWGVFQGGERKGQPKDQIQQLGDDPFDSFSYIVDSPIKFQFVKSQNHKEFINSPSFANCDIAKSPTTPLACSSLLPSRGPTPNVYDQHEQIKQQLKSLIEVSTQ